MEDAEFRKHASQKYDRFFFWAYLTFYSFKGGDDQREAFLSKLHYVAGSYNSFEDFANLSKVLEQSEKGKATRIFYFAIPPSIFVDVAKAIKSSAMSKVGCFFFPLSC
jgi:glucose-6-phosphate 1-dehydrogenase